MAITETKNPKTTQEMKTVAPDFNDTKVVDDIIINVNGLLADYNTKIRTRKTIELKGAARLKLQNLGSVPSTCQIGEMIVSSGKLYICSAADTFTIVGTQT